MWKFCKRYSGLLFLALTFAVVFAIAVSENGIVDAWRTLLTMNPLWGAVALCLWAGFVCARGYTMMFYLSRQGVSVPFRTALRASLIGLFYSGITPAASGGQPMQIYHLRKAGVPVGASASGVMMKFVGFQFMLLLFAALSLGMNFSFTVSTIGVSFWLVALGFLLNAVVVASVLLITINRRAVWSITQFALRQCERLRLIRNRADMEEKIGYQIDGYLNSINSIRDRPFDVLALFGLSGLQVLLYSTILWAVYRAFGLTDASLVQMTTLQLLLYQTVSFVPLPGAAGAQEGVFYLFLQSILPAGSRLGILFAWRFFTFYLTLLAGVVTVLGDGIRNMRKRSRE